MNNKNLLFVLIVGLITVCSGCATIVHGTTQSIPFSTDPSGAEIVIDGTERYTSPFNIILKRKFNHVAEISKEGYQKETIQIQSVLSGAVAGNIIAGGLIGWGVDAISGGDSRLVPESVNIRLRPEVSQAKASPITEKELSVEEKLDQIKKLKNKGKISEEEYEKMRGDILSGGHRLKTISAPDSASGRYQTTPPSPQVPKKEKMTIEPEKNVPESETNTKTEEVK